MRNALAQNDGIARSDWNTTLGELCDRFGGGIQTGPFGSQLHASDYSEDGTPVVMPQDLVNGRIVSDRVARVPERIIRDLSRHALRFGDVVFSRRGDVTRFAVVAHEQEGWLCGTGCIRIRLNCPEVNIPYFQHYLQQRSVGKWLIHQAKGVTMPNLNTDIVRALPFVYPPLAEQRRIAAILDKADGLRQKRRSMLVRMNTLVSEFFYDRFTRHLGRSAVNVESTLSFAPRGWRWAKLTDVARLATGHTPDRRRSDYWNGSIPWLSLSDIRQADGRVIQATIESVAELGIEHSSAVKLPTGTVCFSRTASVGFVTLMGREMATSQDFVNWVCGPELNPVFLMHSMIASRRTLLGLANGSTHRTIYFPTVEEFRCIIPPIHEQLAFAQLVEKLDTSRVRAEASISILDGLFSSLQHRAFRGEL